MPGKQPAITYAQVWDFENLLKAHQKAMCGKRTRPDVARFEYDREWQLLRLRDELASERYRPGAYRRFRIADPKPRSISAAPFRDRVVHHALCNIIEPIFERRFIKDSYASRPRKGIHGALDRCSIFARRYPYVLRCDIVQFFPAVDLTILRRILAREIQDRAILRLCDLILTNGSQELADQYRLTLYPGDTPSAAAIRPRGLPIGNQTSQFWANCYLDRLDHFIKDDLGCKGYVRYVDDFTLFSASKSQLHHWGQEIRTFLATQLRLSVHGTTRDVFPVTTGIPYLGFRVYPTHRRLRRRCGVAFARRLRGMAAAYARHDIDIAHVSQRVQGWVAHVSHGNTYRLRASLLRQVTFRHPTEQP
jgi:retron-type reverse transcriptase